MRTLLIVAALVIATTANAAVPHLRPATPDETAEHQAFLRLVERMRFLDGLFAGGQVPASCKFELIDPNGAYDRRNFFLKCPKRLTFDDIR